MEKMIAWVEIPAEKFERAVDFYSNVLQTEFTIYESAKEKMACFPGGEGAISLVDGFKPSVDGVLVSLNAGNDLDETLARVVKYGGDIQIPKTRIEAEGRGYFATFIDSEGNKLGLYGD